MGGIELVAKNQAIRLAERGHNVVVFSSKVRKNETSGFVDGVNVVRIRAMNVFEKWGIPFPVFSPSIFTTLCRLVKNADVVHIHDVFYMSSFIAAVFSHIYKKPVVLMQHVAMINHPNKIVVMLQSVVYRTTGLFVFRIAARILTINDRVEGFLISHGVSRNKLVSTTNGVDMSIFYPGNSFEKEELKKRFKLNPSKKTVVFVGRFVPKKGFDKLLNAKDDAYQIVFCGGDCPDGIDKNDGRVVFLGKLTSDEVAKVYRAADIFALPSQDEGFPLSIQEAMASGLPIITSDDAGYERYRFNRDLILLLKTPNSEKLKIAIIELVNNEDKLYEMGKYSLQYAKKYFNWDMIITNLENTYDDVVELK